VLPQVRRKNRSGGRHNQLRDLGAPFSRMPRLWPCSGRRLAEHSLGTRGSRANNVRSSVCLTAALRLTLEVIPRETVRCPGVDKRDCAYAIGYGGVVRPTAWAAHVRRFATVLRGGALSIALTIGGRFGRILLRCPLRSARRRQVSDPLRRRRHQSLITWRCQ
jgi:hypothetical protein